MIQEQDKILKDKVIVWLASPFLVFCLSTGIKREDRSSTGHWGAEQQDAGGLQEV